MASGYIYNRFEMGSSPNEDKEMGFSLNDNILRDRYIYIYHAKSLEFDISTISLDVNV